MRQLSEMPKDGQFVAVWEYSDTLWSHTLRWVGDQLKIYNSTKDFWEVTFSTHLRLDCIFYQVKPVESRSNYEQGERVIIEEEQKYTFNINTKFDIDWKKIGEDCNIDNQVLLITTKNYTYIMVADSLVNKLYKTGKSDDLLQKVDLFLSADEFCVLLLQDKRDVGFVRKYLTDVRSSPWPEDCRDKGGVVVQPLNI